MSQAVTSFCSIRLLGHHVPSSDVILLHSAPRPSLSQAVTSFCSIRLLGHHVPSSDVILLHSSPRPPCPKQ
nr:hypothetical protein BgiMline_008494 [Biomphalaria glabrata]